MTLTDRVIVAQGVMARQVGDQTVILDLASGVYFGLDDVGTRVWTLLVQGLPLDRICEALAQVYDAPHQVIAADLLELLDKLAERKLIHVA